MGDIETASFRSGSNGATLPALHRPFDILLHQVGVDGDRCGGSGAGRGDHLGARIDHVAGGPDAGDAGPAGARRR